MPIYIAAGAFTSKPLLASAELALLVSAVASAVIGLVVGKILLPAAPPAKGYFAST